MPRILRNMLNSTTDPIAGSPDGAPLRPAGDTGSPCPGFTLLEVMVSLSIIAIALLAVYGNFSRTLWMSTEQKFNATAPLLAARVVADFEGRDRDAMTDESGDFGDAFSGYTWTATVETVASETLGAIADDLRSIEVVVSFNEGERLFRCKTLRFLRREVENG